MNRPKSRRAPARVRGERAREGRPCGSSFDSAREDDTQTRRLAPNIAGRRGGRSAPLGSDRKRALDLRWPAPRVRGLRAEGRRLRRRRTDRRLPRGESCPSLRIRMSGVHGSPRSTPALEGHWCFGGGRCVVCHGDIVHFVPAESTFFFDASCQAPVNGARMLRTHEPSSSPPNSDRARCVEFRRAQGAETPLYFTYSKFSQRRDR